MTDRDVIALTGGTGFVGQAVCDAIESRGLKARALARRIPDKATPGVEWVQGDLADQAALDRLVEGCSAMIHVAGLTRTTEASQFEQVNVAGTRAVIAACKTAQVKRLVAVSSLSAREPTLSDYGGSKAEAESIVQASGLDWTIVRPPAVYGPRDTEMFELFRTAKWAFVPLPPGGATSVVHVDDLARLLLALVPNVPSFRRKIYEPDDARAGGWAHKELARAIGEAVGRSVLAPHLPEGLLRLAARADRLLRGDRAKLTSDRVGYMVHPNWVVRSDRAVPAEIWQPQIPTPEGLAATARWYREQGWL